MSVVYRESTDRITLTSHTRRHTSARSHSSSLAPCRHAANTSASGSSLAAAKPRRGNPPIRRELDLLPNPHRFSAFSWTPDAPTSDSSPWNSAKASERLCGPRPAEARRSGRVDSGNSGSAICCDVAECNAPGGGAVCGHVRPISEPSTTRRRLKRSFR